MHCNINLEKFIQYLCNENIIFESIVFSLLCLKELQLKDINLLVE